VDDAEIKAGFIYAWV